MSAQHRPLEDLITELVSAIADVTAASNADERATVRPVDVLFDLPVEACVGSNGGRPVILADFRPCRIRTAFDPPLSRLSFTLATEGPP